MNRTTRTLALSAVSLAGSEVGAAYVPIPWWGRVLLGFVTAGTIVASTVESIHTRAELDALRAAEDEPVTNRLRREEEELAFALIAYQHPEAELQVSAGVELTR